MGHLAPLDPTFYTGGVYFGADKLGHFFPNGLRYYERYREALDEGLSEEEALARAIQVGIDQEKGDLGLAVSCAGALLPHPLAIRRPSTAHKRPAPPDRPRARRGSSSSPPAKGSSLGAP